MNDQHKKKFHENTCVIDLVSPLIAKEQYISSYRKGGVNIIGATIAVNDGLNSFPALVSKKSIQPNLTELIDHVDYIANLVGIEHISLGLDYYTGQWPYEDAEKALKNYNYFINRGIWNPKNYPPPPHKYPIDLETPDKIANLTYKLFERGYSEENIRKILGENLLRVFSETWK